MSKRLFANFAIPFTGVEIRCFHDTDANDSMFSVYIRFRHGTPSSWKWVNKLVTRYCDYRSCLLCMDNLVNSVYYYSEHKMPNWGTLVQYMTDYIESNYRPVPKANRKEE